MDIGGLGQRLIGLWLVLALGACVQGPFDAARTPPPGLATPGQPSGETPPWQPVAWPTPGEPITAPEADPFYRAPAPVRLAGLAPGTVVRYRPIVARSYKLGYVQAHAWQFVYVSRDTHDAPVADTASLLIPARAKARLLSYQVAYDALNPICNPSQELLRGTMLEQRFVSAALRRGWSVVLPDHEGPHMAYLSGRQAGHAVLDGLRGAAQLTGRPADPIGLWGYSGGGFATLWAAQMAGDYAPGLPIKGIAAGGVPGDLDRVAAALDGHAFAGLYFQAFFGLANAYPEIQLEGLLNERGRAVQKRLSHSCLGQWLSGVRDPLLSGLGFAKFADYTTADTPRELPAIRAVLAANRLGEQGLVAPLYYYHGALDPIVGRDQARALLGRYCEHHTPLVYDWTLGEHVLAALTQADNALDFLDARLADRPLHGPGCDTRPAD